MENYNEFLIVLGALGKLVIIATLLERGLAFIFEWELFVKLTTRKVADPKDSNSTIIVSIIPGLKALIALSGSFIICNKYGFDILQVIFRPGGTVGNPDKIGIFLTSLIVAGGSAGAILVFQGYLNLSKEGRDAVIEAKKAGGNG